MHVAVAPQLRADQFDEGAGNGEADALAAARLGQDKRIHADNLAGGIDERATAIAGVDGRVGLNIDEGAVGSRLPRHRTHYAHAHGVAETEAAAEGEYHLPLAQPRVVGEGQGGQAMGRDFDQGQVEFLEHADQGRLDGRGQGLCQRVVDALSGLVRGGRSWTARVTRIRSAFATTWALVTI